MAAPTIRGDTPKYSQVSQRVEPSDRLKSDRLECLKLAVERFKMHPVTNVGPEKVVETAEQYVKFIYS